MGFLPCSTLWAKALPTSPLAKDPYQGQNKTQGDLALRTVKTNQKGKKKKKNEWKKLDLSENHLRRGTNMSVENSDHIETMNKAAVEQKNQATCLLNAIQSATRNKDLLSIFIHCDSSKLC